MRHLKCESVPGVCDSNEGIFLTSRKIQQAREMLPAIPEKASCTVRGTCSNIVDVLAVNWPDKVNGLISQVALELLTSILRVMTLAWLDFPLAPDSTINHLILSLIAARFQTPFFPISPLSCSSHRLTTGVMTFVSTSDTCRTKHFHLGLSRLGRQFSSL